MTAEVTKEIEECIQLLSRARALAGDGASFRARILTDMLLIELGRDLARLREPPQTKTPREP